MVFNTLLITFLFLFFYFTGKRCINGCGPIGKSFYYSIHFLAWTIEYYLSFIVVILFYFFRLLHIDLKYFYRVHLFFFGWSYNSLCSVFFFLAYAIFVNFVISLSYIWLIPLLEHFLTTLYFMGTDEYLQLLGISRSFFEGTISLLEFFLVSVDSVLLMYINFVFYILNYINFFFYFLDYSSLIPYFIALFYYLFIIFLSFLFLDFFIAAIGITTFIYMYIIGVIFKGLMVDFSGCYDVDSSFYAIFNLLSNSSCLYVISIYSFLLFVCAFIIFIFEYFRLPFKNFIISFVLTLFFSSILILFSWLEFPFDSDFIDYYNICISIFCVIITLSFFLLVYCFYIYSFLSAYDRFLTIFLFLFNFVVLFINLFLVDNLYELPLSLLPNILDVIYLFICSMFNDYFFYSLISILFSILFYFLFLIYRNEIRLYFIKKLFSFDKVYYCVVKFLNLLFLIYYFIYFFFHIYILFV